MRAVGWGADKDGWWINISVRSLSPLSASWNLETFWFRIFGYGLVFSRGPMMFSERYGYARRLELWGRWRVGLLKGWM